MLKYKKGKGISHQTVINFNILNQLSLVLLYQNAFVFEFICEIRHPAGG